MEEETDKIKRITEDKNRGVDKHPLFYAASLRFRVISPFCSPTRFTAKVPWPRDRLPRFPITTTSPLRSPTNALFDVTGKAKLPRRGIAIYTSY